MASEGSLIKYSCDDAIRIIRNMPHDVPVFMWGPTGVGKTHTVYRLGEEDGVPVKVLIMTIRNPIDLSGLPTVNEKRDKAVWLPPAFLPHEDVDGPEGWIFLDEFNTAPKSVQAAAYQFVLEGRIGDYIMPKGWRVIAAGNRMSDKGVTEAMPLPLANRFAHFEIEADRESWLNWAARQGISLLVQGFIAWRGNEALHKVSQSVENPSFPTPRGWARVSQVMNRIPVSDKDAWLPVTSAIVGQGAATEFMAYVDNASKLPNLEHLLDGTTSGYVLPRGEPGLAYAYAMGLADVLKMKEAQIVKYFDLIEELPEEYQVVSVQSCIRTEKEAVLTTRPGVKWMQRHKGSINVS